MPKHGKKYRAEAEKVDKARNYPLDEALGLVKAVGYAKFNESIDLAARLGVNPKHADQMVRGACLLPAGTGREVRVLVLTKGERVTAAKEAGADYAGLEEYVEKIKSGWFEFDKVIASPDVMGVVGRLGRVLGPRGLMPSPKVGTVTQDVVSAVKEAKAGKISFKTERTGIVHVSIGRKSFTEEQLRQNLLAVVETLIRLRPAAAKGQYIRSLTLSPTMGPGVHLDPVEVQNLLK